ncbi:MAG: Protein GrpE [Parcubacteria group bacterium GW2011_GWD2_38_12]|nr:MAG: Protein GrpE [Parcubacteria group bacterium GW2011_GWC2_36_17]KKQ39653.1 MAG: Protein GrpE [Candidatus Moranbacteria bacterium GW2011_GWF2_37_7]KKQ43708.1 MAG: Protein GrpE [Parcubacteria group bacterium GW2011_GWE2_37_8]KKQ52641.1 MAG: Protein GrpE [Parcubacteria group bacterium GW2011_GWD2_38_12]KKQ58840.1 MAG: Protein GrpE [Parcubacteria group bacterium GW2011_GWC1_38_17]KKQ59594.1 MAG: Protein GrpE [Parcubacteria group bacterium GW2011_GWD1_38_16]
MEDQQNNLEKELIECKQKAEEYLLGWQRERADFVNYKRDETKIQEESRFYMKSKIIYEFLAILDNFDMALNHMPEDLKDNNWVKGVSHIRQQLEMILRGEGAEEIKCIGDKFDPTLHESLEDIESDEESGIILEELQKGYKLDGRVIRPSKVKISK